MLALLLEGVCHSSRGTVKGYALLRKGQGCGGQLGAGMSGRLNSERAPPHPALCLPAHFIFWVFSLILFFSPTT